MNKSIRPIVLAAFVAASAGTAHATGDGGDNSMTPWYGDSWANVQAHNPEAVPVPSLQAQEDAAEARAAWGQTRDRMRSGMHRWRENASNTFHRMTGTGTTGTAAGTASGTSSGTYGTAGSGTTGTTSGTYGTAGSTGTTSGAYGTAGTNGTTGTTSRSTGTAGNGMGPGSTASGPAPIPKQSTEDNPQSRNGSGSWNTGSPSRGGETDPARTDSTNSPVGPSVGGSSR
jgi:hypothetical protein